MWYRKIFSTLCNNDTSFIRNRHENRCMNQIDSSRMRKIILRDRMNNAVSCRYYPAENTKRVIITLHDYKSNPEKDFACIFPFLWENSCSIFVFDMPAHGESDGEFFTFGINERHTCLDIINSVCSNVSDDIPVYIYGMGSGGAVALMTSGMKLPANVHGFIADSAYSHPFSFVSHNIGNRYDTEKLDSFLMKKYRISLHDYCVCEALKSCSRPVLLLHGRRDNEAPVDFAFENFRNCHSAKELHVFEKSYHLSAVCDEKEKYCTCLSDFFEKYDSVVYDSEIHLHYPEKTMFQMIYESAQRLPDDNACIFKGKAITYRQLIDRIEKAAAGLYGKGIRQGDVVTICMPNTPQAVDCLYALNRIGAVASFIHPLSAEKEIAYYLKLSKSRMILTPDLFYEKVSDAIKNAGLETEIIVARIQDELKPHLKLAYTAVKGKDYLSFPDERGGMLWSELVAEGKKSELPDIVYDKNRPAVILYSGGTTGEPKGIMLSDMNFNALAMQARIAMECEFSRGLKNLSAMPMFHGFGLGIGIHTVLVHNACCVLMPQVNTKEYATTMLREKPNFIAGVPTIFRMLIGSKDFENEKLSFLKGMFSGGDSMPAELKKNVDSFLHSHGAYIQVREGYGLTECVTASCLTPKHAYKEGSIGLPFPDTLYKIVNVGTTCALPHGTDGEIVISGPTVMLGYLENGEETASALRIHEDGRVWLHTGDMGCIDSDGYVYFRQRIKRMIVSSGYNIYPSQVEKALEMHPAVDCCCVVGVHDEYRMESIKAYIVLKDKSQANEKMKADIILHCRKYVASYELPREIEFREDLPKTLVGKVAYRLLEEENKAG